MATGALKTAEVYTDFRINMDTHPVSGDLYKLINEDAVTRSIKNILFTQKYERYTDPDFGVGINAYLFEPFTPFTFDALEREIEFAIKNYEPRCELISVKVGGDVDNNSLSVVITYGLTILPNPVTISILLTRTR